MEWMDYLSDWGRDLQGLAQGGLCYGEGGESDMARYRRMKEIAVQLLDNTGRLSDDQVAGMVSSLRKRLPDMAEDQMEALARELLGEKPGITEEQVRAWGVELTEMAEVALGEELENPFDIDRYEVIRQVAVKMRDLEL